MRARASSAPQATRALWTCAARPRYGRRALDALPPPPTEPPAYRYAASDIRPRQAREIELCEKASGFDWQYTGTFLLGFLGSVYLNIGHLKHTQEPGIRLIGPGLVGFTWGGFLGGGYLSLPKCDPTWAPSVPPEGDVRASWPIATTIAILAGATAPVMDFTFLGPVKQEWTVPERSARVFIGIGAGVIGSLFPYLLPPRTWTAKKEIERMRLQGIPGGAMLGWGTTF